LISPLYNIDGRIDANGFPNDTSDLSETNIDGGSGGYVYIECTGDQDTNPPVFGPINLNGGIGVGEGNGGSGGRLVTNVVSTYFDTFPAAMGGLYSSPSTENDCNIGAAGTMYFLTSKTLYVIGSDSALTKMKTPLSNLYEEGDFPLIFLDILYVQDNAIVTA